MSIQARIDDATLLWKHGRLEGAFLNALIAVAATARKRHPDLSDRDAFKSFFTNARTGCLHIEYRGECIPVEHIFYKWMRCELVHTGAMPGNIQFMPPDDLPPGTVSVRAGGAPEYILKISRGWFGFLVNAVCDAPESNLH